jgi:hypothetical protein
MDINTTLPNEGMKLPVTFTWRENQAATEKHTVSVVFDFGGLSVEHILYGCKYGMCVAAQNAARAGRVFKEGEIIPAVSFLPDPNGGRRRGQVSPEAAVRSSLAKLDADAKKALLEELLASLR